MTKPLAPILKPVPVVKTAEGWARPAGSALRHYIRAQQALCGLWGFPGDVKGDTSTHEKCERCAALHRHE